MNVVVPLIGLVATLAPTVGPTVGGYLTDALPWHWLFFINVVPGIGLCGLTYLYPVYFGEIRGYDALMIGKVMFVSGVSMFLTAPVVGRLATKFAHHTRAGFLIFALSNWQLTVITTDWDAAQVFVPQILRGIGLMFAIVPITNLALGTLTPERLKNASGLYNLTRNLGGARIFTSPACTMPSPGRGSR